MKKPSMGILEEENPKQREKYTGWFLIQGTVRPVGWVHGVQWHRLLGMACVLAVPCLFSGSYWKLGKILNDKYWCHNVKTPHCDLHQSFYQVYMRFTFFFKDSTLADRWFMDNFPQLNPPWV